MPRIIGYDQIGNLSFSPGAGFGTRIINPPVSFTAGPNEVIDRAAVYCVGGALGRVTIGIAEILSGTGADGEHLILDSWDIPADATPGWKELTLPTPFPLEEGKRYAVAFAPATLNTGGSFFYINTAGSSWVFTSGNKLSLDSTYTGATLNNTTSSAYFNVVTVQPNQDPIGSTIPDLTRVVGEAVNIDLSGYFSDPDLDTLAFTMSPSSALGLTLSAEGVLQGITSTAGTVEVTVTATDPDLASVSEMFTLSVVEPVSYPDGPSIGQSSNGPDSTTPLTPIASTVGINNTPSSIYLNSVGFVGSASAGNAKLYLLKKVGDSLEIVSEYTVTPSAVEGPQTFTLPTPKFLESGANYVIGIDVTGLTDGVVKSDNTVTDGAILLSSNLVVGDYVDGTVTLNTSPSVFATTVVIDTLTISEVQIEGEAVVAPTETLNVPLYGKTLTVNGFELGSELPIYVTDSGSSEILDAVSIESANLNQLVLNFNLLKFAIGETFYLNIGSEVITCVASVPPDLLYSEITSAPGTGAGYLNPTVPLALNDQVLYTDTDGVTIGSDGSFSATDGSPTYGFMHYSQSSGEWSPLEIICPEELAQGYSRYMTISIVADTTGDSIFSGVTVNDHDILDVPSSIDMIKEGPYVTGNFLTNGSESFTAYKIDVDGNINQISVSLETTLVLDFIADEGVAVSGSDVTAWVDRSPSLLDFDTVTGTPQLVADSLNGHSYIAFDGVDDSLSQSVVGSPLPVGNGDRTVLMVVRYRGNGPGGWSYGDINDGERFGLAVDGSGNLAMLAGGTEDLSSAAVGTAAGWLVQAVRVVDGNRYHYRDAVLIDQDNASYGTVLNQMVLGANLENDSYVAMDLAAIRLYSEGLSDDEVVNESLALMAKYGIVDSAVPNQAPISNTIPDLIRDVGQVVNIDLSGYFSDPDGDSLTFTMSPASGVGLSLTSEGLLQGIITATDPVEFTVTATDPDAATATATFTVTADMSPRISSLPNSGSLIDGSTGLVVPIEYFTTPPDEVYITDGTNSTGNLLVSSSVSSATFNMYDITSVISDQLDSVDWFGGSLTLVVTNTTESLTASRSITWAPRADYAVVTALGSTDSPGNLSEGMITPIADGTVIYYSTVNNTLIEPDLTLTTDLVGVFNYYSFDTSTAHLELKQLVLGEPPTLVSVSSGVIGSVAEIEVDSYLVGVSVTINGVTVPVMILDDTHLSVVVPRGGLGVSVGGTLDFVVNDPRGASSAVSILYSAPPNYQSVEITSVAIGDLAIPNLAIGDVVIYRTIDEEGSDFTVTEDGLAHFDYTSATGVLASYFVQKVDNSFSTTTTDLTFAKPVTVVDEGDFNTDLLIGLTAQLTAVAVADTENLNSIFNAPQITVSDAMTIYYPSEVFGNTLIPVLEDGRATGHFVVIGSGIISTDIYIHDPIYGVWYTYTVNFIGEPLALVHHPEINVAPNDTHYVTGSVYAANGTSLTAVNAELSNDDGVTWITGPVVSIIGSTLFRVQVIADDGYEVEYSQEFTINGVTDNAIVVTVPQNTNHIVLDDLNAGLVRLSTGYWTTDNQTEPDFSQLVPGTGVVDVASYHDPIRSIVSLRSDQLTIVGIDDVMGGIATIALGGKYVKAKKASAGSITMTLVLEDSQGDRFTTPYTINIA